MVLLVAGSTGEILSNRLRLTERTIGLQEASVRLAPRFVRTMYRPAIHRQK